ncbi:hypothetical protein B296_00012193 [Ensete ventricosum]|uniref:Uncharacterized protein n=1 Tax=Ensete ventricosum TaxID=4639 RepID=A0A426YWU8_ENSVE|nr:hypothetical protein B296_00012193 [Ensete ventricosum]
MPLANVYTREGEEALSRSVIRGKAKDGPRLGARSRADPQWPEGAVAVVVAQAVRQRGEMLGRRLYIPVFQIRMEKMKEVKRPRL